MGCSSLWRASINSGRWSVVLKNSAAGVPLRKKEAGGGRTSGGLNIQYSPANGMLNGFTGAKPNLLCASAGMGATSTVTGFTSGHRITP